jgi:hypothetical protein
MEPTLPTGTKRSSCFPEQVKEAFLRFEQWLMLGTGKQVYRSGSPRNWGSPSKSCSADLNGSRFQKM